MSRRIAAVAVALVVLSACSKSRSASSEVTQAESCTLCHGGTDNQTGAPPRDLLGKVDPSLPSVGAHTAHLAANRFANPIACDACHVVPATVNSPGHGDNAVEVPFGPLAHADGVTPSFNPTDGTCTVYCHGASLDGGEKSAPGWTLGSSQAYCGSCHGLPPGPPHVSRPDCETCHPGYTKTSVDKTMHVNGVPDYQVDCTSCHGDGSRGGTFVQNAAPPLGTGGQSATTDLVVGAHQAHVMAGPLAAAISCAECHGTVPADPAHANGTIDLGWGSLATTPPAPGGTPNAPVWSASAATCGSTYCHGAFEGGKAANLPVWTTVNGTQAACGTCHATPPPPPHPIISGGNEKCHACHPGTVNDDGTIHFTVTDGIVTTAHVDGQVEVEKYHPDLWALPTHHGYAANADLDLCRGCHGSNLDGGDVGVSCDACHTGGTDAWRTDCTFCHGSPTRAQNKPAPPVGTQGEQAPSQVAVGAHQRHLDGGTVAKGVACTECHVVPTDMSHITGSVDLAWGPLATGDATTTPQWSAATSSCSATYCHGAFPGGKTDNAPDWTISDGSQMACGTCHLTPPPAPHPQMTQCASCHPGTMSSDTVVNVQGGLHIDGIVEKQSIHGESWDDPTQHGYTANQNIGYCKGCHGDQLTGGISGVSCDSCHTSGTDAWRTDCKFCHGSVENNAPPVGTEGESQTAAKAVGAHQSHVKAGPYANAFGCSTCHVVPGDFLAHAGSTGGPVVVFDVLAGGQSASWNGTTCTTACHGAALALGPGSVPAPAWTQVDGTQAACGACHLIPPPAPHLQNPSCGNCHDGYTGTSVNKSLHVDGHVDVKPLTCTSCHGTSGVNAAPPAGTHGETATTAVAVGAHQAHVTAGPVGGPYACDVCHGTTPTSNTHANGIVNMATSAGWNAAAKTCANACHGGAIVAPKPAPVWTAGDGVLGDCTYCHAAPPPAPHPSSPLCGSCHDGYSATTVNAALHLNGSVDVKPLTCTSCHGTPDRAGTTLQKASPPVGSEGETATTALAVGAHQSHVVDTELARAFTCDQCHVVPTAVTHPNDTVDMQWGSIAQYGTWDRTAATCSASYCHGSFVGGNQLNAPAWTTVNGTQATCGSCHLTPPPPPHSTNPSCGNCHDGYTQTTVNLTAHVNGAVDVKPLTCTSCHGDSARAGTTVQKAAPPLGTHGETAITARAVGAHQAHVNAGPAGGPYSCDTCHGSTPTSVGHSDTIVQLTIPGWDGTNATCTTYCHGATLNAGGSGATPLPWTSGDGVLGQCGFCHGAPPPSPHVSNPQCGRCHDGYTSTTVNASTHLDGSVEVKPLTCTSCHGDSTKAGTDLQKASPPTGSSGETSTTTRAVGAHAKHVYGGALSSGVACSECHVVPDSTSHPDGTATVTFGPLSKTGGVSPQWNGTSCSAAYCHGAGLPAGTNGPTTPSPVWTATGQTATCSSCHGFPPDDGKQADGVHGHVWHANRTGCGKCHSGYTNTTINKATHVNGARDVQFSYSSPEPTLYATDPVAACTQPAVWFAATLTQGWSSNSCTECHTYRYYWDNACCGYVDCGY
jgi:predicted CxxxxCH...CXXCH cytochrome family protein